MTVILAQLFKEATVADAKLIAYLSQGRLGPLYANPQFQVADKMLLRALGERATELFKKLGDLGLVAEKFSLGHHSDISISNVYERLKEITEAGGGGSQEKKVSLMKSLLADLDPLSAKYVARMILGKMRTGFSDMTVLDSLSWMLTGNKSLRGEIEAGYNVRADLGEVVTAIKTHGKPKILEPKIGTPILMAKAERATSAGDIWARNSRCAVEYKLDGLRIQAHVKKDEVKLFSRGLEDVTSMYPDIVQGFKHQLDKDCIVEGEMIAVGENGRFLPFQETVQRKRKYDISAMAGKIPLTIYLFDVLVVEDKNIMSRPNSDRWEQLIKLVAKGERVKLMERIIAEDEDSIEKFFHTALGDGTEGIIAKKLEGPYRAGSRDFNWIKYKKSYAKSALADTIDAVVMGYDAGQGKRSDFGIGDFLIGVYDKQKDAYFTIAKVGTGLTDEEWRRMKKEIDGIKLTEKPASYQVKKGMLVDVWAKPQIVVEVQADEITKSSMHTSGLALRFPRLISWREKQPQDATGIDEMAKIYQTQVR